MPDPAFLHRKEHRPCYAPRGRGERALETSAPVPFAEKRRFVFRRPCEGHWHCTPNSYR